MTKHLERESGHAIAVRAHYEGALGEERLLDRLIAKLDELCDEPELESKIAVFDHFHARGRVATAELATMSGVTAGLDVLDAGSGLGGPSRYLAIQLGCKVVGIDISPAYVEVATWLANRANAKVNLRYKVGDVRSLPFPDRSFDLVWSEHVLMNVPKRADAYAEFARVLRPGGKFAFYEPVITGAGEPPHFPTPWAERACDSFLITEDLIAKTLEDAGLQLIEVRDVSASAAAAFAMQSASNSGTLGLGLVMGSRWQEMSANFARNVREKRIRLVMGLASFDRH